MLFARRSPSRIVQELDGIWDFQLDPAHEGIEAGWFRAQLAEPRAMPVPSSYNDITVDNQVHDHVGLAWYQYEVAVPPMVEGHRLWLRFDSVTHHAQVWVDEHEVMQHTGGYLPFEGDITDVVDGKSQFRLSVAVDNRLSWQTIPPGYVDTDPSGHQRQRYYHDFYNYAGIHRTVSLISKPAVHVQDVTVVTDAEGSDGIIRYDVVADGAQQISVRLFDAAGAEVAVGEGASGDIRVPDAQLWQPGTGYLYTLEVRADEDIYPQPVGIRTVEIRDGQFLINGAPFYFKGYGRHEDNLVRGKGHDDAMMVHDFELMKWQGANSFRTSHYPYDERVLELADKEGFVVIDETAAVGLNVTMGGGIFDGSPTFTTYSPETINDETRQVHAQHIRELVARDKNHPCVVMWSIANEPDSWSEESRPYFEPLAAVARGADPTRPVGFVAAMQGKPEVDKLHDLFDVIMLNRYYGWYVNINDLETAEQRLRAELDRWAELAPTTPIIFTEYGPDTMHGMPDLLQRPWSEDYQTALLETYHRVFDDYPQVVGEQIWNFADFQTAAGIMRVGGNKKGMFTRDRQPKQAAYHVRDRWRS